MGMVDTTVAALGAFAASLLMVATWRQSRLIVTIGWIMTGLTILVKPVGILLALCCLFIFAIELIARHLDRDRPYGRVPLRRSFVVYAVVSALLVLLPLLYACFHSEYLGTKTNETYRIALRIVKDLYSPAGLFASLYGMIQPVIGWYWTLASVVVGAGTAIRSITAASGSSSGFLLRLGGSGIIAAASLYWWCYLAGPIARYYFPFLLLLIVWLLPDAFRWIRSLSRAPALLIATYCMLPATLIPAMLFVHKPPIWLQRSLGVNLSAGQFVEETEFGLDLLKEAKASGRKPTIYALTGVRTDIPHMLDNLDWLHNKRVDLSLTQKRTNEWSGSPGIRITEAVSADYILFEDASASVSTLASVGSYSEELEAFANFGKNLHEEDGVILSRHGRMNVLKIIDRQKLLTRMISWAKAVDWKTDFRTLNECVFSSEAAQALRIVKTEDGGFVVRKISPVLEISAARGEWSESTTSVGNIESVYDKIGGKLGADGEKLIIIQGWLVAGLDRGIAPNRIFVTAVNKRGQRIHVVAETLSRPDVKIYFKRPEIGDNVGFRVMIDPKTLGDSQWVHLAYEENGNYFECSGIRRKIPISQ
jgi:hypothetical protein